ncbi:MAG: hypothetical protein HW390_3487, partial [Candidatus Brocadiaceae bacterium]|nr:hypothetical protein [Candidatus Brocadiaceae bacterium]
MTQSAVPTAQAMNCLPISSCPYGAKQQMIRSFSEDNKMESIEKNGLKLWHIKSKPITEGMTLKPGDTETLEAFVSQKIPCKSFAVAY